MKVLVRRILLRIGLCVALVLFGFFLALRGMRHTIVFDNCEATSGEISLPALEGASVTVDGARQDVAPDDRALAVVTGTRAEVVLEVADASGAAGWKTVLPIRLGLRRMFIVSLPLLAQGAAEPFLEE